MSLSINSQPSVPPGFRFHPTEEELLSYYLRKKVACEKIDLDVIRDVDLNKLEPWDIQEKCRIGSTAQNEWYLFSHKDKKYPTGTRTNRATAAGFWKATGRDKVICSSFKRIGMRKTLVFYNGRAPHGQKSDWIMHEYRLHDASNGPSTMAESFTQEEGWVICRVFKKRSHVKSSLDRSSANDCAAETNCESALDQIFECMGRSCGRGIDSCKAASRYLRPIDTVHQCFAKLPALQSPSILPSYEAGPDLEANDWAALDRLVASHLSGDDISSFSFGPSIEGEGDLWSIAQSAASTASDHLSR